MHVLLPYAVQASVAVSGCRFEGNSFEGGLINARDTIEMNSGNVVGASWTTL
jgi:hypothetical protein